MAMTERKSRSVAAPVSWLDRAILAVAPAWGAKRIATRRLLADAESRFARIEGAQHDDTRGSKWLISRLSPDSQLELDLQTARDRARDIYQNDSLGGAVDSKVNHVVGMGFTPQARVRAEDLGIDETAADEINQQIEAVFERWAPHADRSGRRSLWMCSRLAARHNLFDGESLTILSDVGRADKPIPLAVQVVDPERLETPPERSNDPLVRLGIEYDADGQIVAYHVRKSHPGDTMRVNLKYDRLPADRVLHVFEPHTAEQSRGLPWMIRALNRAKDAKDYDEASILKAQVEACFAAFVSPAFASGAASAIGASSATNADGRRLEDIVPGTIRHLDPGEQVQFAAPASPGNGFTPFMEWNYRRVAAAINWPYEMVVKNWNGLSFAAGRLVLADAKRSTEVDQKILREMWLCRVWARMVEEGVIVGEIDVDPRDYMAAPWAFNRHTWIAPKWEYALTPGEEVTADLDEIAGNLATLEDKLGKRGHDLEDFIARKSREDRLLQEAGIAPAPQRPTVGRPPSPSVSPETNQPAQEAAVA